MNQINFSDKELIQAMQSEIGSDAIESLFDRYGQYLFNKCLIFVENETKAEKLTHEIFLKVFKEGRHFDKELNFSHWLCSITYNICMRLVEKQVSFNIREFDTVEQLRIKVNHCNTEQRILDLTMIELFTVLRMLPADDRIMLLMHYQDGLTEREMAKQFHISEEILKTQLNRARERATALNDEITNQGGFYEEQTPQSISAAR